MDDGRGNILLSKKEANKVLAWDKLKELLESKEVVSVKVSEAVKAGVVAYLEGIRAFIPASKLALSFVEEADLQSYVGKTLDVQVITADEEDDKLVLSAKEILREKANEERKNKISNVEVGLVTEGTVESLQSYGAFIDLGNGISGLCHISQIANQRIAHPSSVLKVGQKVKVKVIAIKDGKLSLSMKALDDVMAKEITEEEIEYKSEGEATTTLADLLKKAGF
jgi:small subunit ribosomal protein S1